MKQERTPILKDIAKQLKLTTSTVSRALNDHPGISSGTKAAVMRVAKQLNYQPNHVAAALRNGKSNIIGLIVPTIDSAFYSAIIKVVEETATKAGYKVMICQSYNLHENEVVAVSTLFNAQVDGIIVSLSKASHNYDHLKNLEEKGIPLLLFGSTTELNVNQIVIDDYRGAYKTVMHLLENGCSKIAHLAGNLNLNIYKDCLGGFIDAHQDYGLPYEGKMVIDGGLQMVDGRNSMKALLRLQQKPDAVFAANDYCLLGAAQVLKENGLRIPEDIALAGFGNEKFAAFSEPPLTSVDRLNSALGSLLAEIFFAKITGKDKAEAPQTVILQPKLRIRGSSLKYIADINGLLRPYCFNGPEEVAL